MTRQTSRPSPDADVCLIVEGCYPYVRGGVSSWVDWLIRSHPGKTFAVVTLWPSETATPSYPLPSNLIALHHVALSSPLEEARPPKRRPGLAAEIAGAALELIETGSSAAFGRVTTLVADLTAAELIRSRLSWDIARIAYEQRMPQAAFLDFFWAWRALFGGLVTVLKALIPQARLYHATCTAMPGCCWPARGGERPAAPADRARHLHNERRIEIVMADWMADKVPRRGLDLAERRLGSAGHVDVAFDRLFADVLRGVRTGSRRSTPATR